MQRNPKLAAQFLALPAPTVAAAAERLGPSELSSSVEGVGLLVLAHDALGMTSASDEQRELLVLGSLIDPRAPARSDAANAERLLQARSFEELERVLHGMAGRWLLIARMGQQRRVYGDAGGLRACFYAQSPHGVVFASQPLLLAGALHQDVQIDGRAGLFASADADAYPPGVTPFPGVKQLLPNHYLDLASGQARRFWPKGPVEPSALPEAAATIAELLAGSIRALSERGKRIALPLTGGYDSRTLLAAGWDQRDRFECFTVVDLATAARDLVIPFRLARAFDLNHRFIWGGAAAPEQLDLVVSNTAGLWRDTNEHQVPAFGKPNADVVLLGNVSEVIRCGFFNRGDYPSHIDAALLAGLSGWEGDARAHEACAQWLEHAPADDRVHVLDLFYWESIIGGWSALDCMATDAFVEVASPYNCRELLCLGLGVEREARCVVQSLGGKSFLLHQRICENLAPELLNVPFNEQWLGDLLPWLRSALPTPMRGKLKRFRETARALSRRML